MRNRFPGYEEIVDSRIGYIIRTSEENQMDILAKLGPEYSYQYHSNKYNPDFEELDLWNFLRRMDEKFVVEERLDCDVWYKMPDESGNPRYDIEGYISHCHKGFDGSLELVVVTSGAVPEALCIAIQKTYPDSEVFYITFDLDGSGYQTNDKTLNRFVLYDYSFGYRIEGVKRSRQSDDIEDACELMAEIGFHGEHTEQALLEFVEQFPIRDEWGYVWFNKLEVV